MELFSSRIQPNGYSLELFEGLGGGLRGGLWGGLEGGLGGGLGGGLKKGTLEVTSNKTWQGTCCQSQVR